MNMDDVFNHVEQMVKTLNTISKQMTVLEDDIDKQLKTLTILYENHQTMMTGMQILESRIAALEERDEWRANLRKT